MSGKLDPWECRRWSSASVNTAEIVRSETRPIFHIRNQQADNRTLWRTVPLEPFRNYVLSAEIKTRDVKITEKGGKFGAHLAANGSRTPWRLEGTRDWTPVSVCFTTGSKASGVEINLGLGGFASVAQGEVWFRDVQFRKVHYPVED